MPVFRIVLTFALVLYAGNSFAQAYVLNGKVRGVDDGRAYIRHRQTGKTDSAGIQNGNLTITGTVSGPEFCSFGLTINGVKDYYFSLFIERGSVRMSAGRDSLNDTCIFITGGKVEKEFQRFQRQVSGINNSHYTQPKADAELEKLAGLYALKHPGSYVSAFALFSYENIRGELARLYERLSPAVQRSYFGGLIGKKLKGE